MNSASQKLSERGRRVIRASRYATLASRFEHSTDDPPDAATGVFPYASLISVGFDFDGSPLMMLSKLALHRRNVDQDPRASLLFDGTAGMTDRLAGPRITVAGQIEPHPAPKALDRFIAQNPSAELYAGFADFALFKLTMAGAHFVAGFGAISWIVADRLVTPAETADDIADASGELIQAANQRHGTALTRMITDGARPEISTIDATGIDITYGQDGTRLGQYMPFDAPVSGVDDVPGAINQLFA